MIDIWYWGASNYFSVAETAQSVARFCRNIYMKVGTLKSLWICKCRQKSSFSFSFLASYQDKEKKKQVFEILNYDELQLRVLTTARRIRQK